MSRGSYRSSYASAQLFRGRRYFWSIHSKIAKTYWNSEAECLVHMSFLKGVTHKSFVFELPNFIFKGSLAKTLRFWDAIELQSFIFAGSLAQRLRFWTSRFHFWRKPRTKAWFLSSKLHFWRKSCPNHLNLKIHLNLISLEPQSNWSPIDLNGNSIDNRITWASNQLLTKSSESEIIWISNQLTTESFVSLISWQPNSFLTQIIWPTKHLNQSIHNQIMWILNPSTTKSFSWSPNHLNLEAIANQII